MTALTSDIARFVAAIEPGAVPARASFGARIGMLDCVGTMIAGADEEAVRLVAQIVPASTEETNFAISVVSAGMSGSFATRGANYATSQALTARAGEK